MPDPLRQAVKRVLQVCLPRRLFIVRGSRARPYAALTFDDGPHPHYTERVLDILRAEGVPATFFVVGQRVAAHRDVVRRIVADGHEVGHHSFTHSDPRLTSTRVIAKELSQTTEALAECCSVRPRFFRPPHGKVTPGKLAAAWRNGLAVALWSIDPRDFGAASAEEIHTRLDETPIGNGDVVLLHDTSAATLDGLADIIRQGQASGLRFVRLGELAC